MTKQKAIVTAAIIADLAVLGVFKYANFLPIILAWLWAADAAIRSRAAARHLVLTFTTSCIWSICGVPRRLSIA